jgi:hypothetical protein
MIVAFMKEPAMPARSIFLFTIVLASTSPALAQNSDPCAAFPWRLDKEKILLSEAAGTTVYAGSYLDRDPPVGFRMQLRPITDVAYAQPPSGPVSSGGFGGVLKLGAPTTHGDYLVTLTDLAAVDVLQGQGVRPLVDAAVEKKCPDVRESVKFSVDSGEPLTLQISGAKASSIGIAITPAWYFNSRPPGVR